MDVTGTDNKDIQAESQILREINDFSNPVRCIKWDLTGTKLVTMSDKEIQIVEKEQID
jgi:hypothetical protein